MRWLLSLTLAAGLLSLASGPWAGAALAQTTGPDGTPQVEAGTEVLSYVEGATPELLTHYWIVLSGVDSFPPSPSPEQVGGSELRKRLLDLRLSMDLNAYAFQPGTFEAYRDAIDNAYEKVGEYKDLFDIQAIDGFPTDAAEQAGRLAKMKVALAPFRSGGFRDDLKDFFYQREPAILSLEFKNQPRLWQIAKVGPSAGLDSAGNAALLGRSALRNLREVGLLVDDIFDPAQEAQFHDVRKALRSVLVLSDMFPSLAARVAEARGPLADVVKAYGDTNDRVVAYHAAQLSGRDLEKRAAELSAAFSKARTLANDFANSGQLEALASSLEVAEGAHRR